uniref:RING-type domain-containing protein n=1 Tax=Panagrolaimus sp. ES5 TaxID=591445 RepID=A0AC34GRW5_9BILA
MKIADVEEAVSVPQIECAARLIRIKAREIAQRKSSKHRKLTRNLDPAPNNKIVQVKDPVNEKERPSFECGICFENYCIEDGCITCEKNFFSAISSSETHSICIECMRGYAHSAITDIPVAFGGLGLNCATPECKNIFLLQCFEYYLSDEDYLPLKLRLQEQCIADASLKDLVTCPNCGIKVCVPTNANFYQCVCGRQQCQHCPRLYDAQHIGKTCQQLDHEDEVKGISSQKMSVF